MNTGDRALDQSLLVLLTLCSSFIISHICTNYRVYYNAAVYMLWRVWKNPMQLQGVPLILHTDQEIRLKLTPRQFRCKTARNLEKVMNMQPIYMTLWNIYYLHCEATKVFNRGGDMNELYYLGNIYGLYDSKLDKSVAYIIRNLSDNLQTCEDTVKNLVIRSVDLKTGNSDIIGNISPRKTFSTLFYDEKDKLIRVLKSFQEGTLYPAAISMDNKLGIMLYGPPGTGKTGTISAIANMLRRDLIIVNCAALTTTKSFDTVLQFAKEQTPQPIIVFDEIDCIMNVLMNPNKTNPIQERGEVQTKWAELLAVAEGEERKEILKMIRDSKQPGADTPLDLGYVLSKLDGLEDNTDRLIIATTNHPDKINPALMRPGRFDLKLCLSNCSETMLVDILSAFFGCTDDEKKGIRIAAIQEFKHSPLHVINTALTYQTLDKTLKALKGSN